MQKKLLGIVTLVVLGMALAMFLHRASRPQLVGFIGPFSGARMSEGQDFFRGLSLGLKNDSFFNKFEMHSMDVNHSRRELVQNVDAFIAKEKVPVLFTQLSAAQEKSLQETLLKFQGKIYSVSHWEFKDAEIAAGLDEVLNVVKASKIHILYAPTHESLHDTLFSNLQQKMSVASVTAGHLADLSKMKSVAGGVDMVVVLAESRKSVGALQELRRKSYAGRVLILSLDREPDLAGLSSQEISSAYVLSLFKSAAEVGLLKTKTSTANISFHLFLGYRLGQELQAKKGEVNLKEFRVPLAISSIEDFRKN